MSGQVERKNARKPRPEVENIEAKLFCSLKIY